MVNQYIFDTETSEVFYEKLEELHDKYVYHLILNGVAKKGTHLESIKMTKNPQANKKYCEKVVGGFIKYKTKNTDKAGAKQKNEIGMHFDPY